MNETTEARTAQLNPEPAPKTRNANQSSANRGRPPRPHFRGPVWPEVGPDFAEDPRHWRGRRAEDRRLQLLEDLVHEVHAIREERRRSSGIQQIHRAQRDAYVDQHHDVHSSRAISPSSVSRGPLDRKGGVPL